MKKRIKVHSNRSIYIIVSIAVVLTAFLSIELIKFLNDIKVENDKLIYKFDEHTSDYLIDSPLNGVDISEQYLSYEISYGVDVSEWQGVIDWEKVRASGISFAMIRCGFREIVGSKILEDDKFRTNIEGATNAGLRVGVYFFGTAKNKEEALEEAEFTYNMIKDYNITYPVAYDAETFDTGRLSSTSYSAISDNILTFTETLGSYGYETMVYSYKNAFAYMLDTGKFDGKLIWLAHFTKNTDYTGNYAMWQYSDSGRVDGINTKVDLNISYFTYKSDIDEVVENPDYVYPPNVEFKVVNELVKTNSQVVMRNAPTDSYPNSLGKLKRNTELLRTGISDGYSRLQYNGRTIYIENNYLTMS